jgi:hypothetical protein
MIEQLTITFHASPCQSGCTMNGHSPANQPFGDVVALLMAGDLLCWTYAQQDINPAAAATLTSRRLRRIALYF